MPWTFSPVNSDTWNHSPRRILFLGPEPNGDQQDIDDMGELFRRQLLELDGHPFVRNTLLHLFGARCPGADVPTEGGVVNFREIARVHLGHMRYCDIKAEPGGSKADFQQVCKWYQANQPSVQGFWTGAGGFAPPHLTVVHGTIARDIFVHAIRGALPAQTFGQFVVMPHPSLQEWTTPAMAAFVPTLAAHAAGPHSQTWSWAKYSRKGQELVWNEPYVQRRCP